MRDFLREFFDALLREWCIAYYRWALREMHPLHPDVPSNLVRVRELEDQR